MTTTAVSIPRRRSSRAKARTFAVRRFFEAAADIAALAIAFFVVYFFAAFIPRTRV
jgi:hypothetical protein